MQTKARPDRLEIAPDSGRLIAALRQIGYSIEQSLADLVDNSINAGATNVLIRFIHDGERIKRVAIVDDGDGMNKAGLMNAMRFGSLESEAASLGKFGMGLKLASLSYSSSLTVVSRKTRRTHGLNWSLDGIQRGWYCENKDLNFCKHLMSRKWGQLDLSESGTIVLWDQLDKLPQHRGGFKHTLTSIDTKVRLHLAMTFHRFLEANRVRIFLDQHLESRAGQGVSSEIAPVNPFKYPKSGHPDYPRKFFAQIEEVGCLEMTAHVWPPLSQCQEYKLGRRASSRQGFYIYRNDRLIQAGGWNGLIADEAEPHNSLARIQIDLPTAFDDIFGLNVQKSKVIVPENFDSVLKSVDGSGVISFDRYRRVANETYRSANRDKSKGIEGFPSSGLAPSLHSLFLDHYGMQENKRGFKVTFGNVANGGFFDIDKSKALLIIDDRIASISPKEFIKLIMALYLKEAFQNRHNRQELELLEKALSLLLGSD